MPGVQFQDEQFATQRRFAPQASLLTRAVYATGLAKTEKGAQTVLLVSVFVIAALAFGVFAVVKPSANAIVPKAKIDAAFHPIPRR